MFIPMAIYVFAISLIGLIFLTIYNKRLEVKTVTIIEYTLWISTITGIILMFFLGLGSCV